MTAGLDDSNLHKGNGMNFPGYVDANNFSAIKHCY